MQLLLDTHIWLWSALDPTRLSKRVKAALEDSRERALAVDDQRVGDPRACAQEAVDSRIDAGAVGEASVERASGPTKLRSTSEVAIRSEGLRLGHRDPADRFIMATALVYELTLVTADKRLAKGREVPVLTNK